jgi:flagellar hook assembly protein FlgD
LRKLTVAIVALLLAGIGVLTPGQAAVARAATGVKVAIIVGATHATTQKYRDDANELYSAALKYTSNVTRVYSPHATATAVKAAVDGASIIIYLGHGNGWPSPYTYDPNYTTKDGFGLNYDLNGDGKLSDYENKYYGEPWIRSLHPAPNAVVLLFHLCYASGNPESGASEPVLANAKKRVDNYAAAFLKAGARAVIANGHSHASYYIDALFTTRESISDYWRNAPDANGHFSSYSSTRSPGYTFAMDPESAGKYYRSIAGKMTLQTQDVTGAMYADTSVDPSSIVVPGAATPAFDGAPVYDTADAAAAGLQPITTIGSTTKLRVDERASVTTAAGASIYHVFRVDDAGFAGWMTRPSLTPRDSASPRVWETDDGAGTFSPNGDGSQDTLPISIRMSESAAWTLRMTDGDGTERARVVGSSDTAAITWAPAAGGLADGTYHWNLAATDAWGNPPLAAAGSVTVDTAPPDVSVADAEGPTPLFTPNGDGTSDSIAFAVGASEPGSVTATVTDAGGATVDHAAVTVSGSAGTISWDGRDTAGAYVPDGTYTLSFVAKDRAGNRSVPQARSVNVFGALGYVASSKTVFFPQDGDSLGRTTTLSIRLRSAATVTWSVRTPAGALVRTIKDDEALAAGTHTFSWDGRDDAGALVPRGSYRAVATATDGTLGAGQAASVVADAFRIAASDATPGRGQRITITATTAEPLGSAARLRVYQPGIAAWDATMTKVATGVYRVTVTLKSSQTGTLRFRVAGYDSSGSFQGSTVSLALH